MNLKKHAPKLLAAVLAVLLLASMIACAKTDEQKYADAQKLLTEGKLEEAITAFTEIENYMDSSKYIMYIKAAQLAEDGQYELAVRSFESLGDFRDSSLMAIYYTARGYESVQRYEEAEETYKSIAAFQDSSSRMAFIPDLILDRDFAAAVALADHAAFGSDGQEEAAEKLAELVNKTYSDDPNKMHTQFFTEAERALADGDTAYAAIIYYMLMEAEVDGAKDGCTKANEAVVRAYMDQGTRDGYEYALNGLRNLSGEPFNYTPEEDLATECYYQLALIDEEDGDYASAYAAFFGHSTYKDCAERAAGYENAYAVAVALMNSEEYEEAIKAFEALKNYSNSKDQIALCNKGIDYNAALALREAGEYEAAIEAFTALGEYKDSAAQITGCQEDIKELEYKAAGALREAGQYEAAIEAFTELSDYKDSAAQVIGCWDDIMEREYNAAKDLLAEEKYSDAYNALLILRGYKDVDSLLATDENLIRVAWTTIGNIVKFGHYEQDNNTENGPEEIEWRVLAVDEESDRVLLISKYALDQVNYNTKLVNITWEKCTLRKWLNNDFMKEAFKAEEQARIPKVTVMAQGDLIYTGVNPGNDTKDKVFLLSADEANRYFKNYEDRKAVPTAYAKSKGVVTFTDSEYLTESGETPCFWWLRSPSYRRDLAARVDASGSICIDSDKSAVDFVGIMTVSEFIYMMGTAVRPALWVNLAS